MTKPNWKQIEKDAGGASLGKPQPYFWLAPIWLILSVMLTPHLDGWGAITLAIMANVISLAICGFYFWGLLRWPFRHRAEKPVALFWVIIAGASVGLMKGVVTLWIYWAMDPSFDMLAALPGKVLSVTFFGMWILPAISISYSALTRYQEERNLLLAELVYRAGKKVDSGAIVGKESESANEIQEFVTSTKSSLRAARLLPPQEISQLLSTIVERDLRPLSHKIWMRESQKIPDFTIVDLARVTVLKQQFPILPILIAYVAIMTAPQIVATGWREGAARIAVESVILFICLVVSRRVKVGSAVAGWVNFTVFVLTSSLLIAGIATVLFGTFSTLSQPVVYFMLVNVIGLSTIVTGIASTAFKERDFIRDQLRDLGLDEEKKAEFSNAQLRERRQIAQHLHSNVQNQMLSTVLKLQQVKKPEEPVNFELEIQAIERALDEIDQRSELLSPVNLEDELRRIHQQWNGLIQLSITTTGLAPQVEPHEVEEISQVVNEAITNAVRHGQATQVQIRLNIGLKKTSIICLDDGTGIQKVIRGLGSTLFDSVSGGRWKLTANPDGRGTKLKLTLDSLP